MPANKITNRLIALGFFLLVACNSQMEYMNNSDEAILSAALKEAQVRGLLENESWLFMQPLIDNGLYKNISEIPEKIGGITVKTNEWIFERNIGYGLIALERIKSENEIHEIQFSFLNSIKERITVQIKLDNNLEFQGYTNTTINR